MTKPKTSKTLAGRNALVLLTLLAPLGCDPATTAESTQKAPEDHFVASEPPASSAAVPVAAEPVHPPALKVNESNALEEGEMPISINFLPRVGRRTFDCSEVYEGVSPGQIAVKPVDFRFFVHNLRLVNEQGQEVPVTLENRAPWQGQAVALLDFENNRGNCQFGGDAETNAVVTGSVPEGVYQGLRFSLGVPTPANHQDPAELGGPFQRGGMSWNWLKGFKFLNVEVQSVNAIADGEPTTGKFHLGSTACSNNDTSQEIECSKPNRGEVFLPNFRLDQDSVIADLGALFDQSDLSTSQICHSGQDACAPMFAQLGVDWASGAPTAEQRMFSTAQESSAPAPVMGGAGLALVGLGMFGAFAAGGRSRRRS